MIKRKHNKENTNGLERDVSSTALKQTKFKRNKYSSLLWFNSNRIKLF